MQYLRPLLQPVPQSTIFFQTMTALYPQQTPAPCPHLKSSIETVPQLLTASCGLWGRGALCLSLSKGKSWVQTFALVLFEYSLHVLLVFVCVCVRGPLSRVHQWLTAHWNFTTSCVLGSSYLTLRNELSINATKKLDWSQCWVISGCTWGAQGYKGKYSVGQESYSSELIRPLEPAGHLYYRLLAEPLLA